VSEREARREALRGLFRERGWSIHMDDTGTQPLDPFDDLAAWLSESPALASQDADSREGLNVERRLYETLRSKWDGYNGDTVIADVLAALRSPDTEETK
jgi:hypothetical protein